MPEAQPLPPRRALKLTPLSVSLARGPNNLRCPPSSGEHRLEIPRLAPASAPKRNRPIPTDSLCSLLSHRLPLPAKPSRSPQAAAPHHRRWRWSSSPTGRRRVHGGGGGGGYLYLHADKDGVGVSLRGARGSLSVAWRVHRVQHGGATRVLLHGAAYGRYLAVRPESAPPPSLRARRACRAVQCVYDAPEQDDVLWEAVEAGDDGGGDVLMRHHRYGLWYDHGDPSAVMRWVIEAIPPRPEPPALPAPSPSVGGFSGLLRRSTGAVRGRLRRIRYVRADDDGNFAQIGWGTFDFCGQSVYRLRGEVSIQLAEPFASIGMMLCVRAGLCGRLTPLVTDLPLSEEPMDVVILTTGSPGDNLLY